MYGHDVEITVFGADDGDKARPLGREVLLRLLMRQLKIDASPVIVVDGIGSGMFLSQQVFSYFAVYAVAADEAVSYGSGAVLEFGSDLAITLPYRLEPLVEDDAMIFDEGPVSLDKIVAGHCLSALGFAELGDSLAHERSFGQDDLGAHLTSSSARMELALRK